MGASPRPAQQQHQQQQLLTAPAGKRGDHTHTRNKLFDLSTFFPTASLSSSSSSWGIPVALWYLLAVSMLLNLLLAFQCLRLSSFLSSSFAACSLLTDPQLNPSLSGDPIASLLSDAAASTAAVPGFAFARYSAAGAGAAGGSAAGVGVGGGGGGSGCHPLPWVRRHGVRGESGGSSSSSGSGGSSSGGVTWSLWPFSLLWNGQPATQTGHARSGSSSGGGGNGTLHAHDDSDEDERLMQKCYGIELDRAEKIFQWHTERVMDHSHVAEIASLPPPDGVKNHWLLTRGESMRPMLEFELLPRYPCPAEIRIGTWGEGGKWLCMTPFEVQAKKKEDIVVYSIGSIGETSFEQHIHDLLGAKAHTFDPTLPEATRMATSDLPYLHFHNIGLTGSSGAPATGHLQVFGQDGEGESLVGDGDPMQAGESVSFPAGGPEMKDIGEIMRMLNHTFVDVFKIDCEGCETGWAEGLPNHMTRDKPLFGQILVEMHRFQEPRDFLALSTLRRLGYREFHLEHNYYDPAGVVEAAFIHESLVAPRNDG